MSRGMIGKMPRGISVKLTKELKDWLAEFKKTKKGDVSYDDAIRYLAEEYVKNKNKKNNQARPTEKKQNPEEIISSGRELNKIINHHI